MNLFTEPPLGPDAHTVADDQHPDHQLRVNRGPSNLTVKGLQDLTETLKVEMPVNAAQQMIGRDMVVEAKSRKTVGPMPPERPSSLSPPANHTRQRITTRIRQQSIADFFNVSAKISPSV